MSLVINSPPFEEKILVTSDFVLRSIDLLGLDSLVTNGIDVFPQHHAISYQDIVISVMNIPAPFLASKSSVHTLKHSRTTDHILSVPDFTESKCSVSALDVILAVVIGDQHVGPVSVVPVRVTNAPVDSCVLSLPQSVHVHRLLLGSALSCVQDHETDALVTNLTDITISLKNGVIHGSF